MNAETLEMSHCRRIAQRSNLKERARKDASPGAALPPPLRAGAGWTAWTAYTGEAMEDTVTSTRCSCVASLASVTLYADPVSGLRKVPLTTQEWYCKGAGMVKPKRIEEVSAALVTGSRMTRELSDVGLP